MFHFHPEGLDDKEENDIVKAILKSDMVALILLLLLSVMISRYVNFNSS